MSHVKEKNLAWDCGTGNGQLATLLANHFNKVEATDISARQIEHATPLDNVRYSICTAEETNFPSKYFDLVTVAQAIHWFNFERFYSEVKRTLKVEGIIAVTGYALIRIDKETDKLIDNFYYNIVGKYWDKERKYIDELYKTIPFPFREIPSPLFNITYNWTIDHLLGYLQTWSAVSNFIKEKNENPVDFIDDDLKKLWRHTETKKVSFPVLLRIGKFEY